MTTLTALTAAFMRQRGFVGDGAETRQGKISRDFLGFGDSVWIRATGKAPALAPEAVAVQHTSKKHLEERLRKVEGEPRARAWLAQGGRIWVIGWGKEGAEITPCVIEVEVPHGLQADGSGAAARPR